jgi:ABC-type lipoprotein release transport system permease subunit
MRATLALAWRNLLRKKGRSAVSTGAVAVVVFLTLLYFGLTGALQNGMYDNLTASTGHLQVRAEGYRELRGFSDLLLRDAGALRARLEAAAPENTDLVPALSVPGLLEGNARSRGVVLEGVSRAPALEARYAERTLAEGRLPEENDLEGIALNESLARSLAVGLGDAVYVYAPGTEGYGAAAYTVVGLLKGPGGAPVAEVSLAAAQELAAPDAVTRMELHLEGFGRTDDATLPGLQQALAASLGGALSVETWRELNPSVAGYLDIIPATTSVVTGIFFVLAGLLVTNTVYLSVIERVREFGVIKALGTPRRRVLGMVLTESLFLCGSGALVGAALGLAVVGIMAQGFSFPPAYTELLGDTGFPEVLYATLTPMQVAVATLFTVLTGVLAALLPALTALRLEPVEAMRFSA